MRSVGVLALVLCGVVSTVGCDSDEPLQTLQSNASINFRASGGRGLQFKVWELYEDANEDAEPDDIDDDGSPDVGLWCEATLATGGTSFVSTDLSDAPWSYSLEVELLRAGETTAVTLTPSSALNVGANRTGYDTSSPTLGESPGPVPVTYPDGRCSLDLGIRCNADPQTASTICQDRQAGVCGVPGRCLANPSIACDTTGTGPNACSSSASDRCVAYPANVTRLFFRRNPRFLTAANRELLRSSGNPLAELIPEVYGNEAGTFNGPPSTATAVRFSVCPGDDIGDPMIAGQPPPFDLQLNKGDVLTVKLGRFPRQEPAGLSYVTEPNVAATLTVDGVTVGSSQLTGDASTSASKPTVAFTYVAR